MPVELYLLGSGGIRKVGKSSLLTSSVTCFTLQIPLRYFLRDDALCEPEPQI